MAEQEKRHKEELYEAEKSVVVGKSVYVLLKDLIMFKKEISPLFTFNIPYFYIQLLLYISIYFYNELIGDEF